MNSELYLAIILIFHVLQHCLLFFLFIGIIKKVHDTIESNNISAQCNVNTSYQCLILFETL